MELLEKETVIYNNEAIVIRDYNIYPLNDDDDKDKNLVIATPLLADYMSVETAEDVIQRYMEFNTVSRTRILAFVHSFADIHYLQVFKDISLATDIKINGTVEKITFFGIYNDGGDITKTFINIYCTDIDEKSN